MPVCYDGEFAPDLAEVARLTGLSPGEVVALHSGTLYHVYMLGFLPGFPYMGDLPDNSGAAASRRPAAASPRRIDLDRHEFDRDLSLMRAPGGGI